MEGRTSRMHQPTCSLGNVSLISLMASKSGISIGSSLGNAYVKCSALIWILTLLCIIQKGCSSHGTTQRTRAMASSTSWGNRMPSLKRVTSSSPDIPQTKCIDQNRRNFMQVASTVDANEQDEVKIEHLWLCRSTIARKVQQE
jgi:hypothetical protein